jgi:hypothetical protein
MDSQKKEIKKYNNKKLNVNSCVFSMNELSQKSNSIDSLKLSQKKNKNTNLSDFSCKSKTSNKIMAKSKLSKVQDEEKIENQKQPQVLKETYIKVNKFDKNKSKNKKNTMKININTDPNKKIEMNGNTYNVHYNNIYNGHPVPVNPMMGVQNMQVPRPMQMMNQPGMGHMNHQIPRMGQMPTTPHLPPNMQMFPTHPQMGQMNPMGYMNNYPYQPYQCKFYFF